SCEERFWSHTESAMRCSQKPPGRPAVSRWGAQCALSDFCRLEPNEGMILSKRAAFCSEMLKASLVPRSRSGAAKADLRCAWNRDVRRRDFASPRAKVRRIFPPRNGDAEIPHAGAGANAARKIRHA